MILLLYVNDESLVDIPWAEARSAAKELPAASLMNVAGSTQVEGSSTIRSVLYFANNWMLYAYIGNKSLSSRSEPRLRSWRSSGQQRHLYSTAGRVQLLHGLRNKQGGPGMQLLLQLRERECASFGNNNFTSSCLPARWVLRQEPHDLSEETFTSSRHGSR